MINALIMLITVVVFGLIGYFWNDSDKTENSINGLLFTCLGLMLSTSMIAST